MALNLNKLFVNVPVGTIGESVTIESIKTLSASTKKIYFVADTNEIVAAGTAFGANPTDLARIAALETSVGNLPGATDGLVQKVAALQALLGAADAAKGTDTAFARIKALEELVGPKAADADDVINKLNEVYAWFEEVAETETGKALIASVAANTEAIGKAAVKYAEGDEIPEGKEVGDVKEAGTGLTGRIEALEAADAVHTTVADKTTGHITVATDEDKVVTISEEADAVVTYTAATASADASLTVDSETKLLNGSAIPAIVNFIDHYDFWETYEAPAQA